MNILEIAHCRKQFDGKEVLSDISLTVDEGQVVSIIGPSGSGKSTLLRCATLLETMDGGALKYLGKSAVRDENGRAVYASHAELKEIRTCFGLVFQNFNLFPHYSVLKNITEAPMLIQKRDKAEVHETARDLLRKMGLLAIYPKKCLSKGGKPQYFHPYLLRGMAITRPNQVWSTDISYIPMKNGFMYLYAVIDVYSRFIVGWRLSYTLSANNC